MAGRTNWLARISLTALAAGGMMITQAAPLIAAEPGTIQADEPDRVAALARWHQLELRWERLREDLTRTALETTLTMFLIRASPTPPTPTPPPPPPPQVVTPPAQGPNTTPPANTPPDPPTGSGDPPTQVDPPPSSAPEPAGIVIALVGAGLATAYGWRKRRGELRKS